MVKCYECVESSFLKLGYILGSFAAISFMFVQLPQLILNFRRKSTTGFSPFYVVIRMLGLSFHVVNGMITNMTLPLLISGTLLLVELFIFVFQFTRYNKKPLYYISYMVVLIPIILSSLWPKSIEVTSYFNPVVQIVCCVPYILECIRAQTTLGISMFGQHLNFLGGILGLYMCSITTACNDIGWLFYVVPAGQSLTIFTLSIYYNEFRLFDKANINEIQIKEDTGELLE